MQITPITLEKRAICFHLEILEKKITRFGAKWSFSCRFGPHFAMQLKYLTVIIVFLKN